MYEQAQQMNDYVIHCTSNFNPTLGHDPVTQNFERAAPNKILAVVALVVGVLLIDLSMTFVNGVTLWLSKSLFWSDWYPSKCQQ